MSASPVVIGERIDGGLEVVVAVQAPFPGYPDLWIVNSVSVTCSRCGSRRGVDHHSLTSSQPTPPVFKATGAK